ncbi:hypothetical protein [Paenibacillus sp. y28]|uniref:hypothetical protein n=1 Tax=Paenibacillus sp. y28 TaxID=3129110 RepID=UPI003015A330
MKKYEDWGNSYLHDFLQVNDLVDEEFVNYFLNELPPAYWTGSIIQIGEPHSHVGGRATFDTLKKTPEGWRYAGHCYIGDTEHRE